MTILLLDTHAYVWALTNPDRLSRRARTAIGTEQRHTRLGRDHVGDGN